MELNLLNLLFVLLAAWGAGLAAARLGYPAVLGELLAGILLGPPLLGLLEGGAALAVLAEAGILLMMLYIGMELDFRALGRASRPGLLAAAGGFITPFVLCYALVTWAGGSHLEGLFVGMAAGVTSLATKSRILLDLKLLDTRIAHVMMTGALITDTTSLILFAALIGVAEDGSVPPGELLAVAGKAVLFFGAAALLGLKVLPRVGQWLQERIALGRTSGFTFFLFIALLFAEMAEVAGMHGILGTFLAGLFLREGVLNRQLSKEVMHLVRDTSIGFLAPIFFITAGFAVSLDVFTADLGLLLGVILLATLGKLAGTALFYLPTGNGWREGLTIGGGMNGRGAVEIIIAQIGLSMGLISQEVFSILVFMAIATTAMVPFFLKWGADWLRRRGELVRAAEDRRGTLIVGAGPTARALGRILARTQPVWIVDRNQEHCAFARADGLQTVCGSALDEQVLSEAQAAKMRHFITLTPNAEVNTLAAQLARTVFLVPEVHVLNSGDEAGHSALLEHLQATTIFGGPAALTEWDYRIDHDLAERTGLPIRHPMEPAALFGSLQQHQQRLPLALRRGDQYLPFHSRTILQEDDQLILFQEAEPPYDTLDRFDRLVARCPVLDLERSLSARAFFEAAAPTLAARLEMDPHRLAEALLSRETTSSTVLLPGLAIPHVVIEGVEQFEILLARCREGIAFPGQAERIHTVFVLAGTPDERNFHLRALSAIAQVVQRADFETKWLMASGPEALRDLVLYGPRRRFPEEPEPTGSVFSL